MQFTNNKKYWACHVQRQKTQNRSSDYRKWAAVCDSERGS